MPKHMRGPREKVTSQSSRSGFSSQRSGRHSCGLGKISGLKWTKVLPIDTMVYDT